MRRGRGREEKKPKGERTQMCRGVRKGGGGEEVHRGSVAWGRREGGKGRKDGVGTESKGLA